MLAVVSTEATEIHKTHHPSSASPIAVGGVVRLLHRRVMESAASAAVAAVAADAARIVPTAAVGSAAAVMAGREVISIPIGSGEGSSRRGTGNRCCFRGGGGCDAENDGWRVQPSGPWADQQQWH